MINRIVRLSFEPEAVPEFLELFNSVKGKIAEFDGCHGLTLLRDTQLSNVWFTYSYWESEVQLNKYRFSDLFKHTWLHTKKHFNDKPIAWSLLVQQVVK